MHIKVQGGTAKKEDLCASCRSAERATLSNGKIRIECSWFGKLDAPAIECNKYENKATPSISDLEKMAWVLTGPKGRMGFRAVKDMTKDEKRELGIYEY